VSAGPSGELEEARALARKALELLLSRFTGSLTGEEGRRALKGLEHLFPEEGAESIEEEGRLRWALRKAFIPPPRLPTRREGPENQEVIERTGKATGQELKVKYSGNPSLLPSLASLAFKLAERGYFVRLKVIRVRDLGPAKRLPPFLLKPLSEKIVRLELEVYPLTSPRARSYL
jgi:hypothetical protein